MINTWKLTPLCEIGFKYGTDKCPQVGRAYYTPFYYELLKDKRVTIRKVLELGVGSRVTLGRVPEHYQRGASLRMWRDFFPNAQIYGVDLSPTAIFQDNRIKTFLYNTKSASDMKELISIIGSDIDLVVDDGTHREKSQLKAVRALMPLLKDDVIYIIEDVTDTESIKNQLKEYNCQTGLTGPKKVANLVIVRKK